MKFLELRTRLTKATLHSLSLSFASDSGKMKEVEGPGLVAYEDLGKQGSKPNVLSKESAGTCRLP